MRLQGEVAIVMDAVDNITKGMAIELAADQIRVNAVCPLAGGTLMVAEFSGGKVTPEKREMFLKTNPLCRFSQPLDISNAAHFLASDEASMITGTCIEVDGGR
jgi:NAD(P)-dependent dehydrogenase (short-subunit alcohol dehydrogenase family)